MKTNIIKVLTLTLFISLMSGFIAYRSGFFGGKMNSIPMSPNGSTLNNTIDTISKTDSIKHIRMMSSSKSIILRDQSIIVKENSLNDTLKSDSTKTIAPLIHSSKSGFIFKSDDVKLLKTDTIPADSNQKNDK